MPKKIQKTPKNNLPKVQKLLTYAGLFVVLFAIIATLFSLSLNQSFHYFFNMPGYFSRYVITIVGGFAVGALLAYIFLRKQKKSTTDVLFYGVVYGLLAFMIWLLLDLIRVPYQEGLEYPWGKILFEGIPLLALVITTVIAFVAFLTNKSSTTPPRWLKLTFVGAFVVQQLAMFIPLGFISSDAEISAMTFLIALYGLILTPIVISVVAYFALRAIASKTMRLFYAAIIGVLYQAVMYMVWEFRTNPEHEATLIFSTVTSITLFAAVMVLIFSARSIARKK